MKLQRILVRNFVGAAHVEVPTHSAIQFFCGQNKQGKSSTRDAIALALSADLGRIKQKKDIPVLLHNDAPNAEIEVVTDGGDSYSITLTRGGRMADSQKGKAIHPAMPYVVSAQRFGDLSVDERRRFMLELMQISLSATAVEQRLMAIVNDPVRVSEVRPFLRHGFAESSKRAQENATAAKTTWRTVTGEAYGPEKAVGWQAAKPTVTASALEAAEKAVVSADAQLAEAQRRAGVVESDRRRFDDASSQLASLRGKAGDLVRRREKLAHDEAELKQWQNELDEAIARAGTAPRAGLVHDLARAVQFLIGVYGGDLHEHAGVLKAYELAHGPLAQDGVGDAEARARVPMLTSTRDLMASAVRNSLRDLREAEEAAAGAKLLEDQFSVPFDLAAASEADDAVRKAGALRKELQAVRDALRKDADQAAAADRRTLDAKTAHEDVIAWTRIADALGPDGIPLVMLREAVVPFNARLAQSAVDAEWDQVVIGDDMHIRVGGRPYNMLSKSEKWRSDAMIAEAISYTSGLHLFLLDEFDLLDLKGRGDCLAWLEAAEGCGEIHSVLLFGTLLSGRPAPGDFPESVDVHWIEEGKCVELMLEGS